MKNTNDMILNVDLEKRTAKLLIPYFQMNIPDTEEMRDVVSQLSTIENLVALVEGNNCSVSINYDFGVHIPEKIWEIKDNSFIKNINDSNLSEYWDNLCKEAILEFVKQYLPIVFESTKKSLEELIKLWQA